MQCVIRFLLAGLLSLLLHTDAHKRVAIVGGGVGGAFTAWYLSQHEPSVDLTIFEASGEVGGRVQELVHHDAPLELGASIVSELNFHVAAAVEAMGLEKQAVGRRRQQRQQQQRQQQQQQQHNEGERDRGEGAAGSAPTAAGGSGSSGGAGSRAGDGKPGDSRVSIYDGSRIAYTLDSSTWRGLASMAVRYGPSPLLFARHTLDVWRRHFQPLYGMQNASRAFEHPQGMLEALGLWNYTQMSFDVHVREALSGWRGLWGAQAFADELLGAASRCNYNQHNAELNAFAGLCSYIPASGPGVFSVQGGNRRLVEALIKASGAQLRLGTAVREVRSAGDGGGFLVTAHESCAESGTAGGPWEPLGPYDAVILATPLELAGISIAMPGTASDGGHEGGTDSSSNSGSEGGTTAQEPLWFVNPAPREYQQVVTTYVEGGTLDPAAVGAQHLPAWGPVLTTDSAKAPFTAVAPKRLPDGGKVYKIFSGDPLDPELLQRMFGSNVTRLAARVWKAYPKFRPPERFAPFWLAPGLCYLNTLESLASAMEISALAARNCQLLVSQHLATTKRVDQSGRAGAGAHVVAGSAASA